MVDAENKIYEMAISGELDPAFVLTVSKTYSSIKESPYSDTEIADIMMHLYFMVQEQLAKDKPPEIRILKYLLTIEDPLKTETELNRALTSDQSATVNSKTHEFLSTTRFKLLRTINEILYAYNKNRIKTISSSELTKTINPGAIQKLREIHKLLV